MDKRTQFLPRALNQLYTKFPQYLSIKFLPDFGDLFADSEVKLDSLFNFVDRMNSRGVIFAAELLSDARKTHVQFATQQIHSNLPRRSNVFVALTAAHFFAIDLEVAGGFVDDLLGG